MVVELELSFEREQNDCEGFSDLEITRKRRRVALLDGVLGTLSSHPESEEIAAAGGQWDGRCERPGGSLGGGELGADDSRCDVSARSRWCTPAITVPRDLLWRSFRHRGLSAGPAVGLGIAPPVGLD